CFLSAITSGLDHPLLFLRAGWSSLWTTGAQSAEQWMRRAVECAPHEWIVHFGLGSSLRGQGRIEEAFESFERALAQSEDDPNCLWHLYECRYAQNRLKEAEAFARRAVDVASVSPRSWTTLGIVLVSQ